MSRRAALKLLRRSFRGAANRAHAGFPALPGGARITERVGDYGLRLRTPGAKSDELVLSALPLRTRDQSGRRARVDLTLAADGAGDSFEPSNPLVDASFPERLSDGIEIGDDGLEVRVEGESADAGIADRQQVFYGNAATDTDVLATPVATGVELFTQVRSADSPETQTLSFTLPVGGRLRATGDGGAEVLVGDDRIARILPPQAADADGYDVPVAYQVDGDKLEVHVDHTSGSYAYPILVDPVIEDWGASSRWANSWFFNPNLDQLGWFFGDSPSGGFVSATQGTAVRTYGAGPGRGLYVFAKPGTSYSAGSYGEWVWRAPGRTTFIPRADFGLMYRDTGGDAKNDSLLVNGIWSERNGVFTGAHVWDGTVAGTSDTVSANFPFVDRKAGNTAVFGLLLPRDHKRPKWTTGYLGGAAVYLDDPEAPVLTDVSHGSSAWNAGQTGSVTATASDPGLGVRRMRVTAPGGEPTTASHPCFGTRFSECPSSWTTTITYPTAGLPDGISTISLTAEDVLGHESAPAQWAVKVDRSAPTLDLAGALRSAERGWLAGGDADLQITARDGTATSAGSGVKSVEVLVDGQRVDYREQACAADSCGLSRDFVFHAADYQGGRHTVRVVATDFVGHTVAEQWTVTIDRSPPLLDLSGSLWDHRGRWLGESQYTLRAAASDSEAGMGNIQIYLDGQRRDGAERTCDAGGCDLTRAWDLHTGDIGEGPHTVKVVATDLAGQPAERSFDVKIDRTDPSVTLSGEVTEHDGGWLSGGSHGLHVTAADGDTGHPGSGVVAVDVNVDGVHHSGASQPCDAGNCTLEHDFALDSAALGDGRHTIDVVVTDAVGRRSTRSQEVGVDTAGPVATVTGPLRDAEGHWLAADSSSLSVSAADSGAGIVGVSLLVDGDERESATQECAAGGCSLDRTWSVALDGLSDGQHRFELVTRDGAQHVRREAWSVYTDRTDPALVVTGALRETPVISAGSYGLTLDATDAGGSGVTRFDVLIDGQHRYGDEQGCPSAGCSLHREPAIDLSDLQPGNHVATVVATDAAGRQVTSDWTFMVAEGPGDASCHIDPQPGDDDPCPGGRLAVGNALVEPELAVDVTTPEDPIVPGDQIPNKVQVSHDGAYVSLGGKVDLENKGARDARVRSYWSTLEYWSRPEGRWVALAGTGDGDPSYTARVPLPDASNWLYLSGSEPVGDGVTFESLASGWSAGGWPFAGTTLAPGATARWEWWASTWLDRDEAALVNDPARSGGLRQVFHYELTSSRDDGSERIVTADVPRRLDDLITAQSAAIRDASVELDNFAGDTKRVDPTDDPRLASIAPGDSLSVEAKVPSSRVAPKGAAETDTHYLARLRQADNSWAAVGVTVRGSASGTAHTDVSGDGDTPGCDAAATCAPTRDPDEPYTTSGDGYVPQHVPIVSLALSGSDAAEAGTSATYQYTLRNEGGQEARPELEQQFGGDAPGPVDDVPATLAPLASATATSFPVVPDDAVGDLQVTGRVSWRDRNGSVYGPVSASRSTTIYNDSKVSQPIDAPTLDASAPASVKDSNEFLYSGPDKVQFGVAPAAIEARTAAVLRGRVLDRTGVPMTGVHVQVLDHPEYGITYTRTDGDYYMAVNGGGPLVLRFDRPGYLPVERTIDVPWQDYVQVDDASMVKVDPAATSVDLSGASPPQVAEGSTVSDQDGVRESTLVFPADTDATMTLRDGSTLPLVHLTVHQTEYTVGPNGPDAMPAPLPDSSGYTYAVEYSVEEAEAVHATSVNFNRPVISYTTNFLGFPVGGDVPAGYLDRTTGHWVASKDGRIIKVLSTGGGAATLDVDGTGTAATAAQLAALGIDDAELRQIASQFQVGDELWRVPIDHFTPWDYNWPWGPPDGSQPPSPDPDPGPGPDPKKKQGCVEPGSVIECESQVLGEDVDVDGTPFKLSYRSDRTPGRRLSNEVSTKIVGDTVPAGLRRINVEGTIAGQTIRRSYAPVPNQRFEYTWDGRDEFGRQVQGSQQMSIRVGYVYEAVYQRPAEFSQSFGRLSGVPISADRNTREITMWSERSMNLSMTLGNWDARAAGLGGWTLDVHHAYDPTSRTLYLGDGTKRIADGFNNAITTVAGDGQPNPRPPYCYSNCPGQPPDEPWPARNANVTPTGKPTFAANGDILFDDSNGVMLRRLSPDGMIIGDRGGGTKSSIVAEPGGSYLRNYDIGWYSQVVRFLAPPRGCLFQCGTGYDENGEPLYENAKWVSGNDGTPPHSGEGDLALGFSLHSTAIEEASDGTIYLNDNASGRPVIRAIGTDGRMTTVAGGGDPADGLGDGGPASKAALSWEYWAPTDFTLGPDGVIYIADPGNNRVRRVGKDGIITTIAGTGAKGFDGDGGPARDAKLSSPSTVSVGPDGSLYIGDSGNFRVRRVATDGTITTYAGNGEQGYSGDGGAARAAKLAGTTVGASPDGSVYISDGGNNRLRRVGPALPGFAEGEFAIPSGDGSEVYRFDSHGRHVATIDARTGAALYRFGYDDAGHLSTVKDRDGNETRIEHDDQGAPSAIVSPDGVRTDLGVDANGFLDVVGGPAGDEHRMTYSSGGLLEHFTDPSGHTADITYDSSGRLSRDNDPGTGDRTLTRHLTADGWEVAVSTSLGRTTTHRTEQRADGVGVRSTTRPDGTVLRTEIAANGATTEISPDGTRVESTTRPDPRFGPDVALPERQIVTTPGGRRMEVRQSSSADLADPSDPLTARSVTEETEINGKLSRTVFDRASGELTQTTAEGRVATMKMDSKGRAVEDRAAGLSPVRYTYDDRGHLATVAQGSRTWTYRYDDRGNLASVEDPLHHESSFDYDAAGRTTAEHFGDGRVLRYGFDSGRLTSITPPGRSAWALTPSANGVLEAFAGPAVNGRELPPARYAYNDDGDLTTITRADGSEVRYHYDAGGRIDTVTDPRGETDYTYDSSTGLLRSIETPDGETTSTTYDGALPTRIETAGPVDGTFTRTYDDNLRMASSTVNGGPRIDFAYDDDGLMVNAGQLSIERDADSGVENGTTLGAATTATGENEFGEVATSSAAYGGNALFSQQFERDDIGRVTTKTEAIDGQTATLDYRYDDSDRLVDVRRGGQLEAHYDYDANGNRLSEERGDGATVSGTYDEQDRLIRYGANEYGYSDNGDVTRKTDTTSGDATSYRYDALGQLASVDLPGGRTIAYVTDGNGDRVGKKVDGALVQGFVYDDDHAPVAELSADGQVVSRFVYGTTSAIPDYMIKGGRTYRIFSDDHGSPRLVVDTATGDVAQRLSYDTFGNLTADSHPGFQPFGYAGGLYDRDTGLTHFGVREYDAETGRFTSRDPVGFEGGDPNLYTYAAGDPVNFVDPTGTDFLGIGHALSSGANWVGDRATDAWNASRQAGANAARYWADVTNDPNAPAFLKGAGYVFGPLASLWNCDNADDTLITLATAGTEAIGVRVASKAGWRLKEAFHSAHHAFRWIGKQPHLQWNIWRVGVKGSGKAIRVPMPNWVYRAWRGVKK